MKPVSNYWRQELLPQLTGLPLIPCGAGEKYKAPIDPSTGFAAKGWQYMSFTPDQIAEMGDRVLCVGMRLGPDAGGIVCFDIDGLSAVHKLIHLGVDPDTSTWRVGHGAGRAERHHPSDSTGKAQSLPEQAGGLSAAQVRPRH